MNDIRITRGNDFLMKVRLYSRNGEGEREPIVVANIQNLDVRLRNYFGQLANLTFQTGLTNDIDVSVDGKTIGNGAYTIEVTGLIDDRDIRASEPCVFCIVERSNEASITTDVYEGQQGIDFDMTFQFFGTGSGGDSPEERINQRLEALEHKVNDINDNGVIDTLQETLRFLTGMDENASFSFATNEDIDNLFV